MPLNIDEDEDDYDPDFYTAEDTEQILNKLEIAPPEDSLGQKEIESEKAPEMSLRTFSLPAPPPLTSDQATQFGEGTVSRVFEVMQTLEEPGKKSKAGLNRLAASAYDRDAWITIITRLATRATAGLEASSDEVKVEYNGSMYVSLSNTIREALFTYVLEDFRKRIDVAVAWLCEEWYNDQIQDIKLGNAKKHYETWVIKILDGFVPYLDKGDKVLTRFLGEIPALTREVLERVKSLCRDPSMVQLALTSLLYLIIMRPPVREIAIDAVEDIWNTCKPPAQV
jgi:symplekin